MILNGRLSEQQLKSKIICSFLKKASHEKRQKSTFKPSGICSTKNFFDIFCILIQLTLKISNDRVQKFRSKL